ncbi:ABC-three component system protein [Aeromonas sp. MR16]|uniref:ABC-three component system protein n=1 Tax=Aeromonas sp. MR16 TaxID=2923420 RepID=UPI001F4A5577|nr:ABC-three component system protein [Aeromonas sp. MR16]MCH7373584.1 alpha/beta hydrolase [Aeromonas sp. MR16]
MSMIVWEKKENKPNAILFVHGLKGGQETWSYSENITFPKLLASDPQLADRFDIGCFNYFTTFTNTYGVSKSLFSRLFGSMKKVRKNLPITEIAELLRTEFYVNLNEYERVIIIAHSMGGLVSKACILNHLEETQGTVVKGFISLAVPHSGAKIASMGSFISSNVQLADLSVLSDAIYKFSNDWVNATNPPPTKYVYGTNDPYVEKKSALAIESNRANSTAVEENHSSICKPKDNNETVYRLVVKYILEFESICKEPLIVQDFQDQQQYDDHFFVLKMVIADVHHAITGHAKGYFFNAEEARKLFTSDHDKKLLGVLYNKINEIYRQEYEHHIAHKTTPDQFVQSVHAGIMKEDSGYLKCILTELDSVHKKGMIHQLANKCDTSIVWSSNTTMDDIIAKKGDAI